MSGSLERWRDVDRRWTRTRPTSWPLRRRGGYAAGLVRPAGLTAAQITC